MDCFCNQTAIRSHHKSAHFCVDSYIAHISRNKYFLIYFLNTCTDHTDIIWNLIRFVCNSNTAGQIDKADLDAKFFFDLHT